MPKAILPYSISIFFLFCTFLPLLAEQEGEESQILFDGENLDNWSVTDYAGHGEVKLDGNGSVSLEFGIALTGIHWTGKPVPRVNYEIQWEALKEMGTDFFGSLTFPFKQNHATLILGGWGGGPWLEFPLLMDLMHRRMSLPLLIFLSLINGTNVGLE